MVAACLFPSQPEPDPGLTLPSISPRFCPQIFSQVWPESSDLRAGWAVKGSPARQSPSGVQKARGHPGAVPDFCLAHPQWGLATPALGPFFSLSCALPAVRSCHSGHPLASSPGVTTQLYPQQRTPRGTLPTPSETFTGPRRWVPSQVKRLPAGKTASPKS